jgi:hypothetical protein
MFLMAPVATAANNVSSETINHIVIAIVLALAIGFVEIVKHGIIWILGRSKKEDDKKEDNTYFNGFHPVAQLDPATVKILKEMHGEATDTLREVASALKDVSKTQNKLIDHVERVEEKIETVRDEFNDNKRELLNAISDWRS